MIDRDGPAWVDDDGACWVGGGYVMDGEGDVETGGRSGGGGEKGKVVAGLLPVVVERVTFEMDFISS